MSVTHIRGPPTAESPHAPGSEMLVYLKTGEIACVIS